MRLSCRIMPFAAVSIVEAYSQGRSIENMTCMMHATSSDRTRPSWMAPDRSLSGASRSEVNRPSASADRGAPGLSMPGMALQRCQRSPSLQKTSGSSSHQLDIWPIKSSPTDSSFLGTSIPLIFCTSTIRRFARTLDSMPISAKRHCKCSIFNAPSPSRPFSAGCMDFSLLQELYLVHGTTTRYARRLTEQSGAASLLKISLSARRVDCLVQVCAKKLTVRRDAKRMLSQTHVLHKICLMKLGRTLLLHRKKRIVL